MAHPRDPKLGDLVRCDRCRGIYQIAAAAAPGVLVCIEIADLYGVACTRGVDADTTVGYCTACATADDAAALRSHIAATAADALN